MHACRRYEGHDRRRRRSVQIKDEIDRSRKAAAGNRERAPPLGNGIEPQALAEPVLGALARLDDLAVIGDLQPPLAFFAGEKMQAFHWSPVRFCWRRIAIAISVRARCAV